MKTEFEKYLSSLLKEGIKGYNHLRIYEIMIDFLRKENETYNNAHVFINMTLNAHINLSMYHLFKIYDTHRDSININKFLTWIDCNKAIFGQSLDIEKEINIDLSRLKENGTVLKNLRTQRNKYYTHLDVKQLNERDDFFERFPILKDDLKNLYNIAERILNKYSIKYNDVENRFELLETQLNEVTLYFDFVEKAYTDERKVRLEKLRDRK